ncbi:MAG: hypothetical protein JSU04_05165 [Bdellovibrionales bacterium]|nr:hypothetical protein [Bdellovibrionales bacterium]
MKTHHRSFVNLVICASAINIMSCHNARLDRIGTVGGDSTFSAPSNKVVNSSETVAAGNKEVDFLLVLDDSNSMMPELKKLSARLTTFVSFLEASQIDWQMCVTTTRASNFGKYLNWKNYSPAAGTPKYLLKKGSAGLPGIFTSTINSITIGGGESGDERAIKAAYVSFENAGPCYRPGAAISVIAISDEDERSVGGDKSLLKHNDAPGSYQALEKEDIPSNLLLQAQDSFGKSVRFTFNSIIVKPGDIACEKKQDADTSPSHPGKVYAAMSALTDGGIGSICDTDYSANLNTFKDKIVNSLRQLTLQCEPVEHTLKVVVDHQVTTDYQLDRNILRFNTDLIEGTQIDLTYDCVE